MIPAVRWNMSNVSLAARFCDTESELRARVDEAKSFVVSSAPLAGARILVRNLATSISVRSALITAALTQRISLDRLAGLLQQIQFRFNVFASRFASFGAGARIPMIGDKLSFLFGLANPGNPHNFARSVDMMRRLNRIGLFDTDKARAILTEHLLLVLNNPQNIVGISRAGRLIRESLLPGPNGFLRMRTAWEGDRLITVWLFPG